MDLRPRLERLDRLVLRSEGLDPDALTFAFRPLWQLDAPDQANVALAQAQASAVYAGLNLWPAAVTARLVEAQVAADGAYPNAEAVFAKGRAAEAAPAPAPAPVPEPAPTLDFDPAQPRAPDGRWTAGGGRAPTLPFVLAGSAGEEKRELEEGVAKPGGEGGEEVRPIHPVPRLTEHGPLSDLPVFVPPPLMGTGPRVPPKPELPGIVGPGPFAREGVPAGSSPRPSASSGPSAQPPAIKQSSGKPSAPAAPASRPSVSEPARPEPGMSGASVPALESIEVPQGLRLTISGRSTRERASSYEEAARATFNFNPAPFKNARGDVMPDGVQGRLALEVKYVDSFQSSLRNPDYGLPFLRRTAENDAAQAEKYERDFAAGVLWVTNSIELADIYTSTFKAHGLKRSRVIVVPSVRK